METKIEIARVQYVILDPNHEFYTSEDSIGTIGYTLINQISPIEDSQLNQAKPYNSNLSQYPLINEIVYLLSGPSTRFNTTQKPIKYYLSPLGIYSDTNSNAYPDILDENLEPKSPGEYFKEIENIYSLQPYEGDTLIEGRLGQSIRFGSIVDNTLLKRGNPWSEIGEIGNPITIIRNGQKDNIDKQVSNFTHILEDINNDDSSIYLCTNQKINLTPASTHRESYGEVLNTENTSNEEINQGEANEPLDPDVQEDVNLNTASNLPPQELQQQEELSSIESTDTSQFDQADTENQGISTTDDINLPNNYEIPDTVEVNTLSLPLGTQEYV